MPGEEPPRAEATEGSATMNGHRVVPGRIEGRVLVMPEFQPGPWPEFDILVARHTDPGWSLLLAQSKGLVIEQGGLLSHASIVARELSIPTLVGVDGATLQLRTGDRIVLDATSGTLYPSTHA
jgi:pyruvate,water dikinase